MMSFYFLYICLLVVGVSYSRDTSSYEEEIAEKDDDENSNFVQIEIYSLTAAKFDDDLSARFYNVVASEANRICEETPADCSLRTFSSTFGVDDVSSLDEYPMDEGRNTVLRFSLEYPDGKQLIENPKSEYYVHKMQLEKIAIASSKPFHKDTGYHIIWVNDEELPLPPNNQINIIMICVGFLILIAVILTYVILKKVYGDTPDHVRRSEEGDTEEKERLNHEANSGV